MTLWVERDCQGSDWGVGKLGNWEFGCLVCLEVWGIGSLEAWNLGNMVKNKVLVAWNLGLGSLVPPS